LLPILLPLKSLTINDVTDVADFPDLHINLARFLLSEFAYYEYFAVIKSGWPSSFGEFGLPGFPQSILASVKSVPSVVKFFKDISAFPISAFV
jgi:hypothetical protein